MESAVRQGLSTARSLAKPLTGLLLIQGVFFVFISMEKYIVAVSIFLAIVSIFFIFSGQAANGLILLPLFLYVPFKIPGLAGITFSQIGVLFVLLSLVIYILIAKANVELHAPPLAPILLILLAYCLSLANAKYVVAGAKDILKFVEAFILIMVCAVSFVTRREHIIWIFMSFIFSGLVAAVIGLVNYLQGYDSRVFGLLGGGFGAFVSISIIMGINVLVFSDSKVQTGGVLLALPIMVAALILGQTRAWLVGFFLAIFFLLYHMRRHHSIRVMALVVIVSLATIFLFSSDFLASNKELITRGAGSAFETGLAKGDSLGRYVSVLMRLFIWVHCFGVYMQHPILGVGIGNLRIKNYFTGELAAPSEPNAGYVDNHWLNVLYESGIFGIVGWIWLTVLVFQACRRLIKMSIDPEWKLVACSLTGSLIVLLTGSMFWSMTVVHEMTVLVALLMGLIFASLRLISLEKDNLGT